MPRLTIKREDTYRKHISRERKRERERERERDRERERERERERDGKRERERERETEGETEKETERQTERETERERERERQREKERQRERERELCTCISEIHFCHFDMHICILNVKIRFSDRSNIATFVFSRRSVVISNLHCTSKLHVTTS